MTEDESAAKGTTSGEVTLDKSQADLEKACLTLLASPSIASRHWVFDQFDHQDDGSFVTLADDADANVVRLWESGHGDVDVPGIALSSRCDADHCSVDARGGVALALAEVCRDVSCVGATPMVASHSLGFSAGANHETLGAFGDTVAGLSEACAEMDVLVSGGAVSAVDVPHGETFAPTVSVVGRIGDCRRAVKKGFEREDDVIVLVGETIDDLAGSRYLSARFGVAPTRVPELDFELEKVVQKVVRDGIVAGLVKTAHSCTEGGLACAVAECCLVNEVGCRIGLDDDLEPAVSLFAETPSRILVSVALKDSEAFADMLDDADVPYSALGSTGGNRIVIGDEREHKLVDLSLDEVADVYSDSLERFMNKGRTKA